MCVLGLYFQDTHCYSFRYLIEGLPSLSSSSSNVSESIGASSQLNVYVLDHESGVQLMPVWSSGDGTVASNDGWKKVELALNPLAYQVLPVEDSFCELRIKFNLYFVKGSKSILCKLHRSFSKQLY